MIQRNKECPNCGSHLVVSVKSDAVATYLIIALITFGFGLLLLPLASVIPDTRYKCRNCGHYWDIK